MRQRTMTVAEYEVRFTQLSHYASVLVATEKDKCRRFEEGLNYEIQSKLTPTDLRSYQDLRAAAIRAERLMKERERFQSARKSKRAAGSHGGEPSGRPEKKRSYATPTQYQIRRDSTEVRGSHPPIPRQSGSRAAGTPVQTTHQCSHCGRYHPGECRLLTGACLICGEQGHFYRECPCRRKVSAAASEPTVQHPRQGGSSTTYGRARGRGRGRTDSAPPTMGR